MEPNTQYTGLEGTPLGDAVAKREIAASEPEKGTEEGEDEALRKARLTAMEEDRQDQEQEVEKIARRK